MSVEGAAPPRGWLDRLTPWAPTTLLFGVAWVLGAILLDSFQPGGGYPGMGPLQRVLVVPGGLLTTAAVLLGITAAVRGRVRVPWKEPLGVLGIVAQLGVLLFVLRQFEIENPAFREVIVPMTMVGVILNHLVPANLRVKFFAALSLYGALVVFGLTAGLWLIGVGLALIAAAHVPIRFAFRVGLVLLLGVGLAAGRVEALAVPWPVAIWPILGSMFMFRLVLYMYELAHTKERWTASEAVAYFFLLPNLVFPLFPVVDFSTFRRTYYDRPPLAIYQNGVRWVALGTVHLIIYRLIYQGLVLSPAEIASGGDLAQYVVANFGLYLRVSGQFHVIVGLLHLFGFRLPETHHFFFIASSLTDFWRRINIYWKDFMQKVFHYPIYFRLRKRGERFAMCAAIMVVFVATWALHSYQWFWILGRALVSWTDALFWTLLAVLLMANVLFEMRFGRKRSLSAVERSIGDHVLLALRTTATFTVIALLWALWTSPTMGDWFALWDATGEGWVPKLRAIGVVSSVGLALAIVLRVGEWIATRTASATEVNPIRALMVTAPILVGLVVFQSPRVRVMFPTPTAEVLRDAMTDALNSQDAARLQRGYYEELVGVNQFNSRLWELYSAHGRPKEAEQRELEIDLMDYRGRRLRPLMASELRGAKFRTNRWGMRDRHYEKTAGPAVWRVALLGSSYVMGWGVEDDETFEALAEARLQSGEFGPDGAAVEILNFATTEMEPSRQLETLTEDVAQFGPNVAVFVVHPRDRVATAAHVARRINAGIALPDYLERIVGPLGLDANTPRSVAEGRIVGVEAEIYAEVYSRLVSTSRELGATPVMIYLSQPGDPLNRPPEEFEARARAAGFEYFFDISDAYTGHAPESLQVQAPVDEHPNRLGHQLIAERFLDVLARENPELLGFDQPR